MGFMIHKKLEGWIEVMVTKFMVVAISLFFRISCKICCWECEK